MIVFNLKVNKEKNDREQVIEMIENMGVRVREEEIIDVVRMRKKEVEEVIKPIIMEFQSEYNKWTVLRSKSVLREMNDYKNVFLEQDLSKVIHRPNLYKPSVSGQCKPSRTAAARQWPRNNASKAKAPCTTNCRRDPFCGVCIQ